MIVVSPSLSRIYLLRHAEAGWPENGQKDFDRSLNDAGYAQAEVVTDRAADKNYRPELVICSTAMRCRQTSDAVRRNMCGEDVAFRFVDELYDSPLRVYMEILAGAEDVDSVMLIGHNPAMSETLQALVGPQQLGNIIPHGYPTCGLAVLARTDNARPTQPAWKVIDFLDA
ncbi:histidine phosphatase family protein [Rhizobium sp.]|jgi:phosphohistidine phosphatase|uniref:SixA phosphatase family protein n=1 Tax=Rhizobium sp. TaxID=391 RepID=UPI000E7EBB50|nr:phosphohistidine phosphatase [Rhizobium sp.]